MIITYEARRRLQGGVTAGDIIVLDVPLSSDGFNPDIDYSESVSKGVGGYVQTSEKFALDMWSIKTAFDDVNSYADYMQFLYSVLGGKRFSITDYDNNDEIVNVKMVGKWGQDSTRRFNAGEFNYSFTARATDEKF